MKGNLSNKIYALRAKLNDEPTCSRDLATDERPRHTLPILNDASVSELFGRTPEMQSDRFNSDLDFGFSDTIEKHRTLFAWAFPKFN